MQPGPASQDSSRGSQDASAEPLTQHPDAWHVASSPGVVSIRVYHRSAGDVSSHLTGREHFATHETTQAPDIAHQHGPASSIKHRTSTTISDLVSYRGIRQPRRTDDKSTYSQHPFRARANAILQPAIQQPLSRKLSRPQGVDTYWLSLRIPRG